MLALPRVLTLQRGGSTLPMQVARLLAPEWRSPSTLDRKRLEWGAAATLQDLLGSPQETAVAYLNLPPFAIHRGDIRGIAAFADVAFGKTPAARSRAECAMRQLQWPRCRRWAAPRPCVPWCLGSARRQHSISTRALVLPHRTLIEADRRARAET